MPVTEILSLLRNKVCMPPHPTHASYTHVVQAGLENIDCLLRENADPELVANEVQHLSSLNEILTKYLLYADNGDLRWNDSEHRRYWNEIRPAYMRAATRDCIWRYLTGWTFLAFAIGGHELMDAVDEECEQYRPER